MFAQTVVPVARPELAWDGLLPLLILSGGALALVLFRSLVKRLPASVATMAVPAMGAVTVIGAWLAGSFTGNDVPLAGVRDAVGEGLFVVGLAAATGFGAWLARALGLGFDAAFTAGLYQLFHHRNPCCLLEGCVTELHTRTDVTCHGVANKVLAMPGRRDRAAAVVRIGARADHR